MVRIATVNDAEQLNILNDEFNGESETSIDNIRNSLMNNKQEVVIVADEDDMLVGFVCFHNFFPWHKDAIINELPICALIFGNRF